MFNIHPDLEFSIVNHNVAISLINDIVENYIKEVESILKLNLKTLIYFGNDDAFCSTSAG